MMETNEELGNGLFAQINWTADDVLQVEMPKVGDAMSDRGGYRYGKATETAQVGDTDKE